MHMYTIFSLTSFDKKSNSDILEDPCAACAMTSPCHIGQGASRELGVLELVTSPVCARGFSDQGSRVTSALASWTRCCRRHFSARFESFPKTVISVKRSSPLARLCLRNPGREEASALSTFPRQKVSGISAVRGRELKGERERGE